MGGETGMKVIRIYVTANNLATGEPRSVVEVDEAFVRPPTTGAFERTSKGYYAWGLKSGTVRRDYEFRTREEAEEAARWFKENGVR